MFRFIRRDGHTVQKWEIDEARLKWLVDYQIDQGRKALSLRVHGRIGDRCRMTAPARDGSRDQSRTRRVPVLAGAAPTRRRKLWRWRSMPRAAGADGTLQNRAYYNKPTQAAFYAIPQIARATKLPIILYNIPGRTGVQPGG